MKYLILLLAIVTLLTVGFGLRRKKKNSQEREKLSWPKENSSVAEARKVLENRDPWEIAAWLTAHFPSSKEIWPNLKTACHELGLEGIYLGALGERNAKRDLALEVLALIGSEKSLPLLFELLTNREERISFLACQTIVRLGLIEAVPYAVDALLFPSRILPARSGEILTAFGSEAVPYILKALPQADSRGKIQILELLGELKDKNSLPGLESCLTDPEGDVRAQAVTGLSHFPEAGPMLLRALKDSHWKVQAAAARGLGKLKYKEAVPYLQKLSSAEDWHLKTSAEEALEEIAAANQAYVKEDK
ncbi:HEAT repeat domain-containing protein [Bacillota bacterium LX-D]|nr:HEAT repeat domain-containing protein [Bacillota bacterium LX-D]